MITPAEAAEVLAPTKPKPSVFEARHQLVSQLREAAERGMAADVQYDDDTAIRIAIVNAQRELALFVERLPAREWLEVHETEQIIELKLQLDRYHRLLLLNRLERWGNENGYSMEQIREACNA